MDNEVEDLVQDCSNSIANTLELLLFCTKPLRCPLQGAYILRVYMKFRHLLRGASVWKAYL